MIDHYDVFYIGGSTGFAYFRPPLSQSADNAEATNIRVLATQRELIDWARGNLDHPVRVYTQNGHLKWTYAA